MLTRDISLDDCILDLVDNSIDGAWKTSTRYPSDLTVNNDLEPYSIRVRISNDQFEITDNCGGITLDDAVKYAFTFGRSPKQTETDFSVGVYGIGMKRAAFKIGDSIVIDSTYREGDQLTGFRVPIKVRDWLVDDGPVWDFQIDENDAASEPGVRIQIKELSDETRSRFADPTSLRSLRRVLSRDYMVPLMRGLSITVNDVPVAGSSIRLVEAEQFVPMRDSYDDGEVKVEIIAGMYSAPPDSTDPEEGTGRPEEASGWYVICNGRVVLAADRSALTGWGVNEFPRWHPQYTGFIGVLFFSSKHAALLPMTTTKRSVDVSSAIYRRALAKIQVPTRAWTDYTNKRKNDESVKSLEALAKPRDISTLPASPTVRLPSVQTGPAREEVANINYAVPLRRMHKLASAFGRRSLTYREVGVRSFDYAYDDLVDEADE